MQNKTQINVCYFVVGGLAIMMRQNMWSHLTQVEVLPYSEVQRYLEADPVEDEERLVTDTDVHRTCREIAMPNSRPAAVTSLSNSS